MVRGAGPTLDTARSSANSDCDLAWRSSHIPPTRMPPMTLPWMAAKIVLRPVGELRAHGGNARMHSVAQIEQIKASMLAFGFTNPLLVDEDGVLIAGHGRLDAAQALGVAKVPAIVLRHLSPAQKEALRLAATRRPSMAVCATCGIRGSRRPRVWRAGTGHNRCRGRRWSMPWSTARSCVAG